jgi:hypothetical protein
VVQRRTGKLKHAPPVAAPHPQLLLRRDTVGPRQGFGGVYGVGAKLPEEAGASLGWPLAVPVRNVYN